MALAQRGKDRAARTTARREHERPWRSARLLEDIRRFDPDLARQASRALASVALNVAEANGRVGRDRLHLFRVALGSLREVGAALDVATALGWLGEPPLAAERDRLCGLIYGCQRPKRK